MTHPRQDRLLGEAERLGQVWDRRGGAERIDPDPAAHVSDEALPAERIGGGHPIHHPIDPRAQRVLQLADERGVSGQYVALLREFPAVVEEVWGKPLPMNLTAPMAAVLLDLDVPKGAVRGIPILARTLGLIGHLAEEQQRPIGFLMSYHGAEPIEYDGG